MPHGRDATIRARQLNSSGRPLTALKLPGRLQLLLCLYFVACIAIFAVRSVHWKQVNDPIQLHYLCFLLDQGMAPYRDLLEINLPGTYLVNWSVMHTLGAGSVAWRVFDFGLMALAAGAMIAIAWPYDWLAGALGATLFILYHGRDGAGQMGQRDLVIAVLLLCSYALLFYAFRARQYQLLFAFGLCFGLAVTIKPLPLLLFPVLVAAAVGRWKRANEPVVRPVLYALLGLLLPIAMIGAFLASEHALGSFWYLLDKELPFYQHVGRQPLLKLMALIMTAALKTLAMLALAVAIARRESWSWESKLLFTGVLFGALSFVAQGKGFPYHRYPMLGFLFLWAGLQFILFLRSPGVGGRLAQAGLCFSLVLLPIFVSSAGRKVWMMQYEDALTGDLERLGGALLSRQVQCLDVAADCDATLYRLRLVQATGLFYDYLIFGAGEQPVIREERRRFWQQFEAHRPMVIVVGKGLWPNEGGYEKLDSWPLLQHALATGYTLYADRSFARSEAGLRAYRIYVDKQWLTR